MNIVILTGRLVKEPELKQGSKSAYTFNSIAVKRDFKEGGEYKTDFINFTAYDKVATFLNGYCKKGDLIEITGRWTTKKLEDGRTINDCTVDMVNKLAAKTEEEKPTPAPAPAPLQEEKPDIADFIDAPEPNLHEGDDEEDKLPF